MLPVAVKKKMEGRIGYPRNKFILKILDKFCDYVFICLYSEEELEG